MKGCNFIFYTPEYQYEGMPHGEMCGDLMPFYENGVYTFIYLPESVKLKASQFFKSLYF